MNPRKWRIALFALCVAIVVAVTAFAFLLAFGGNWDYMVRVAHYPRHVGWMGPATVEGLLVITQVAILALATAPLWVRVQLWVIFLGAGAASVAGNVLDAMDQGLSMAPVVTRGSWPLAVIASTQVCVLLVRYFLGIVRRDSGGTMPAFQGSGQELMPMTPLTVPDGGAFFGTIRIDDMATVDNEGGQGAPGASDSRTWSRAARP